MPEWSSLETRGPGKAGDNIVRSNLNSPQGWQLSRMTHSFLSPRNDLKSLRSV